MSVPLEKAREALASKGQKYFSTSRTEDGRSKLPILSKLSSRTAGKQRVSTVIP